MSSEPPNTTSKLSEQDGTPLAYVAFGGNVGDVRECFRHAWARLAAAASGPVRGSHLYRTEAVGVEDQPDYLNAVLEMPFSGTPRELLSLCLAVERECGRDRRVEQRWGPRTLDLDLLLHGDETVTEESLTLPHPRMVERRFVLEPLTELAPDLIPPGWSATIIETLEPLPSEGVNRLKETLVPSRSSE
jgi:2-amino-4-hydroxy-6-hydroxymethyldihydropteridine diphosphokinase